ncbi:glycosyltransferase family 39 protein [Cellulomonas sp. SLBN-39]|uniref:glycosyltransferase family 39 protein n=1 Tax=Cellulomonas sp. SLBN-39 TaxID=2768446 RepID=UPI0011504258|nr:glycosyltransferase family 39 protein [Cellulomonas sp. SLBN-39]TQL03687.1 dolichyl-phosphate-mannose-protein mannosyltransferase [Cellulomonas sp. SLBN-39]
MSRVRPPAPGPARPWSARAADGLVHLPDALVVLFAVLALVSLVATLLGALHAALVLPVAGALAVLVVRSVPHHAPRRGAAPAAGVALLAAAAWACWGVTHVGQYVVVARDPGFLTLEGLWLAGHPDASVPVGGAAAVASAVPGVLADAEAFTQVGGALHAQGNKTVPALLGLAGQVAGTHAVLAAGVVIGAVALLAVYVLGRELVGPVWALLPPTTLALSLPFLTFTRSAYTEPTTTALVALGVALLVRAVRSGRATHAAWAGCAVGLAGAARIDGAIVVGALVVALAAVALVTRDTSVRSRRRSQLDAAAAPALALTALGYVDLALESPAYLVQHLPFAGPLAAGLVLTTVVGRSLVAEPVARRLVGWRPDPAGRAADVLGGCVAVVALVLVSRPWWLVSRSVDDAGVAGAVGRQQLAEGLPLDPTRGYDEMTLTWLAWYVGWPLLVLGLTGAALVVRRAVRRADAALLAAVVTLLLGALPYVVRVSITPDQLWAVRRLVPVAVPALLVLGVWALREGCRAVVRRQPSSRVPAVRVVLGAAAVLVALWPLSVWSQVHDVAEQDGRLDEARAACARLEDVGVSRVLWVHSSPFQYAATLRIVCDVEVVQTFDVPTPGLVEDVTAAWGGAVAVMSFDPGDLALVGPAQEVVTTTVPTAARRIAGRPFAVETTTSSLWLALPGT